MINTKKLNIQEKIKLFKELYKDISSKGVNGDTELAHINSFEKKLLIKHGGSGTINYRDRLTTILWWWRRWRSLYRNSNKYC
jgi:hypothetical protein